jgi:hypothetical protein
VTSPSTRWSPRPWPHRWPPWAAEQERAGTGGLPDPGVLVTADEAGLIRMLALVSARLPGLVIRP